MKTFLCLAITVLFLGGISTSRADDIMTPDGYLGHPAFELGVNGSPDSHTYTDTFSYTNYTAAGTNFGSFNYNFNRVFLNVYFPVDPCFTLVGGGSYLFNATGVGTIQTTANNFTGTENVSSVYNYSPVVSWFFSVRVYTK